MRRTVLSSRARVGRKLRALYTMPMYGQYMTREITMPFQQDPVTKLCTFVIPEETLDDLIMLLQSNSSVKITKTP